MYDLQSFALQKCITFFIPFLTGFLIVLCAIHLDGKISGCNIEIDDIVSDHLLTFNRHRQTLQKIIPKMTFFFCHACSQLLGVGRVNGSRMNLVHFNYR